jgi:hypothetical protein
MLDLLAQATQPASPWTPELIIGLVTAISAAIVAIITALRAGTKAESAKDLATEARVESAETKGATGAMQQTVTRISNRQNAAEVKMVDLAEKMPPPKGPTQ